MHEFRLGYQTMNMDVLRKVPKRFQECAVIDAAISHEAGRDRVRILAFIGNINRTYPR
jgi:hypothetical protein